MKQRSIGICLGATNIKVVELAGGEAGFYVDRTLVINHESNPREAFVDTLRQIDIDRFSFGMLTGRKFKNIVNAPFITEPLAVESGLAFMRRTAPPGPVAYSAIASLGAENFIVYPLDADGNIETVEAGNKCASGTGEFFLQQIRRMNIGMEEAVNLASGSEPYKVSGRCSVFCKSDCTHALNKGVPIGRVTAGLCGMMAEKILDLLEKANLKNVIAVGGVTRNHAIMDLVRKKVDHLLIPDHAEVFEALGAAYFAAINKKPWEIDTHRLFKPFAASFDTLPPLSEGRDLVRFEESPHARAEAGDECILGLDVGSTTTKAVLLRPRDNAVIASVYLRTSGNPVKASRECYWELDRQVEVPIVITGLGTTGSGRQIAGLHASTDAVVNEIIAHAAAAAFYDREVDTIFEIGGQDAKYTYLTGGVPSDYAMNEACSAGTGSFLEEASRETLGIDFRAIEGIALTAKKPLNFNDQCAAFISSDIKTATHEGIEKADIVAGLVYSICMNYVNRVRGQRSMGKKIFMQGGVCYNKAVPLAMANLIGKEIIVPPDPGLLGAFGVALEVKNRMDRGELAKKTFDLKTLAHREIEYGKSFTCAGGGTKCDRKCEISMMIIDGNKYPFGGACNKYYNLLKHVSFDEGSFDFVRVRQELLFDTHAGKNPEITGGPEKIISIGVSRAFLTNMLFPLFSHFFTHLGCRVVLSDEVSPDGIKLKRTTLCYPAEISHGCFYNLLRKDLDFIFLPKIIELSVENSISKKRQHQCCCMLLQSEAYCLKSAFKGCAIQATVLSPALDFSQGWDTQQEVFVKLGLSIGKGPVEALAAYRRGVQKQREFFANLKAIGKEQLKLLESAPHKTAVVLFGRPYNAFASEANLGIPGKFASAGTAVIPWDFLPIENEPCDVDMCWAIGQNLMKAASFVEKHPQLFGAFITNFSCGPDSFLVGYFRDIMKTKPSLTLELDSHTADAGVNTRIEAFLDIVKRYRAAALRPAGEAEFLPARVTVEKGKAFFISSDNERVSLHDRRVHVVFPSMGKLSSEIMASIFTGIGIRSSALPVYDFEALKLGRGNSSCKECLPLQLTTGGLLKYLKHRTDPDELFVYFMPTTPGNCRFTQYSVFLNKLIAKNKLRNVALLTLTNEDSYAFLAPLEQYHTLQAIIVSDIMEDIKNALAVLAADSTKGLETFERQWDRIKAFFGQKRRRGLSVLLKDVASELSSVRLRHPLSHAKKVALLGEIFVRKDYFACQDLLDRLRERDIIVKRAHFFEWLTYCDYLVAKGINEAGFDMKGALEFQVKRMVQSHAEKKIKRIMAQSGLYEYELTDMETIIRYGKNFFDLEFTGEPIVVAGCFFRDIITHVQGVISIGPFACMPTRVCEEVLSAESTAETKRTLDKAVRGSASPLPVSGKLPFLSIESDGNPFPQIIEARIEAFCLQVERLFQKVEAERNHSPALSNAPVTATYFSGGVKDEDAKESVIKGK